MQKMQQIQLENLTTKFLGRNIIYYPEIDSTQLEVWKQVEKGTIQNGTIIIADKQTKGKGTHGRKWYTEEENNIAFTFFIEANCEINRLEGITIEIAKMWVEVFKKLYGISLEIKFPNDLVYQGKKIGGILTETKIVGEIVKYMVIGIRYQYQSRTI